MHNSILIFNFTRIFFTIMDEVRLSDLAQEYWDYVERSHKISGRLLEKKNITLEDPDEEDMLFMFNAEFCTR